VFLLRFAPVRGPLEVPSILMTLAAMDNRTKLLLEAPLGRLLLSLTAPNTAAFLVQASVNLTEVWFVSQLGTQSLAAMALVFPLLILTQTMSGGALGGAISSSIARNLGAQKVVQAEKLIWHAIFAALAGASMFLLLFAVGGEAFLAFLGGDGDLISLAMDYCWVLFIGGFVVWLSSALGAVFRGMGLMGYSAGVMVLGAGLQIPLSGGLILGWFGLPALGLAGAALSTILVGSSMAILFLVKLTRAGVPARLRLDRFGYEHALFEQILKVARPASLSPILTVATILGLTALVGQFGTAALAGYGIGTRIEFLMIPIVFSIGTALTTIVGTNVGAGAITRAERAGWWGSGFAAAIAGGTGIVLALLPDLWIPVFTDDSATYEVAKQYIQTVGPAYAFLGIGLVLYFASQGAAAMTWAIIGTILRFIVSVGLAAFWVNQTGGGLKDIFIAGAIGMVSFGLVIAVAVKMGAWRRVLNDKN